VVGNQLYTIDYTINVTKVSTPSSSIQPSVKQNHTIQQNVKQTSYYTVNIKTISTVQIYELEVLLSDDNNLRWM
jgi:hypothetical protein